MTIALVFADDDVVRKHDECPHCGENRVDWLIWCDDKGDVPEEYDLVECQTCGVFYCPMGGR